MKTLAAPATVGVRQDAAGLATHRPEPGLHAEHASHVTGPPATQFPAPSQVAVMQGFDDVAHDVPVGANRHASEQHEPGIPVPEPSSQSSPASTAPLPHVTGARRA